MNIVNIELERTEQKTWKLKANLDDGNVFKHTTHAPTPFSALELMAITIEQQRLRGNNKIECEGV